MKKVMFLLSAFIVMNMIVSCGGEETTKTKIERVSIAYCNAHDDCSVKADGWNFDDCVAGYKEIFNNHPEDLNSIDTD